jgi:hypothetical protein
MKKKRFTTVTPGWGHSIESSWMPVLVVVLGLEPTAPGLGLPGSALEHVGGSPLHVHAPPWRPFAFSSIFSSFFLKAAMGAAPCRDSHASRSKIRGLLRVGCAEGRDDVDTL